MGVEKPQEWMAECEWAGSRLAFAPDDRCS